MTQAPEVSAIQTLAYGNTMAINRPSGSPSGGGTVTVTPSEDEEPGQGRAGGMLGVTSQEERGEAPSSEARAQWLSDPGHIPLPRAWPAGVSPHTEAAQGPLSSKFLLPHKNFLRKRRLRSLRRCEGTAHVATEFPCLEKLEGPGARGSPGPYPEPPDLPPGVRLSPPLHTASARQGPPSSCRLCAIYRSPRLCYASGLGMRECVLRLTFACFSKCHA